MQAIILSSWILVAGAIPHNCFQIICSPRTVRIVVIYENDHCDETRATSFCAFPLGLHGTPL